jgi:electron transfer flavoprotein beta subunit
LNVVVCVKQTPDSAAKISVENGKVTWDTAPVLNPWDEYAVEEAIRLKEKHGGKATALCLGPEGAKEALKTCIAMGCDEAVLISDAALENADAMVTAYVLAQAIQKIGNVDAAIFGKQAIDGDTGLVPMAVARRLGWAPLTYTMSLDVDPAAKTLKVTRLVEQGKQVATAKLPAVIGTVKEINEPRYPSFMGIRKAGKATIPVWSAADAGADSNHLTASVRWPSVNPPPAREGAVELLDGAPEEVAVKLADKLIADKVI